MKNSFIIIINIFFFFLINISQSQHSSFILELEPNQEICLNEYYKMQTVVIYEVTSEIHEILSQIKAPNGHIIYYNTNNTSVYSFNSQYNGYYNFCMKNNGKIKAEVNFLVKSGIGANDYSSVAKSKDLEPIDFELDKILKKESLLNHFNIVSKEKQSSFGLLYSSISNKIIFHSILMMIGMILIGVVEALYLKRFMERRKII